MYFTGYNNGPAYRHAMSVDSAQGTDILQFSIINQGEKVQSVFLSPDEVQRLVDHLKIPSEDYVRVLDVQAVEEVEAILKDVADSNHLELLSVMCRMAQSYRGLLERRKSSVE